MSIFTFYREPRSEQLAAFEKAKDAEYWFHNWDPRVGKTKEILDQFRYNYERGRVTALLVIGYPATVHLVWGDEAPKDLPPDFLATAQMLLWRSGRMGTKAAHATLAELLTHDGPVILAMNCEAILSESTWSYLRRFFVKHRVMLVGDEDWATHWSARTKRLLAMGRAKNCVLRRWLSGTAEEESPMDLYFMTSFLKPGCLGFTSMAAFRARYTEYEQEEVAPGIFAQKMGYNRQTGSKFPIVKGYRNLPELREKMAKFSDRVQRRGSNKAYATRYFVLTAKQRSVYDTLRDRYMIDLSHGQVPVANVLTRMTRLATVARNFWPPERIGVVCGRCGSTGTTPDGAAECESCAGLGYVVATTDLERIDDRNPAAEALVDELKLSHRPFTIWCRHVQEVVDVLAAARTVYPNVGRYDGTVPSSEREDAYHAFQHGELMGLVATERSGLSRAHDLSRAKLICYYSNEWGARDRKQSEERGESMDPDAWTDIVDLVAVDTRDLDAITALREKRSIAEMIRGDRPSNWI